MVDTVTLPNGKILLVNGAKVSALCVCVYAT
jgi:hypothetical protein